MLLLLLGWIGGHCPRWQNSVQVYPRLGGSKLAAAHVTVRPWLPKATLSTWLQLLGRWTRPSAAISSTLRKERTDPEPGGAELLPQPEWQLLAAVLH